MSPERWAAVVEHVRRLVRARVGAADADDVAQEAIVRIARGLAQVRDDGALLGWASAVVRGTVADFHRARQGVVEAAELEAPSGDDPSALTAIEPFLEAFLALVPEPYREAVRLVDLAGRQQVEVAKTLGIPLSTMKSRVQRGRAMLREQIERCCEVRLDRGVADVLPRSRIKRGRSALPE